jgi:hypothetical protein
MKKLLSLAFLLVTFSSASLMAQNKQFKWSAAPGVAIPTGLYSMILGVGGDIELKGEYLIAENINLTGSLGVGMFSPKTIDFGFGSSKGESMTFIPAIIGLDYNIKKLHVGIGVGYANYFTEEDTEGGFTFRPQVGIDLTERIQLNVKYTSTSTSFANINYIGISPVFKF